MRLLSKNEAMDKIFETVDLVADVVKSTLGPSGRTVLIDRGPNAGPTVTKDGVTVASYLDTLEDPASSIISKVILQAAEQTARNAGDGPQPLYSRILTPTGWTTMGEIKVGDEICGTNGTTQKVLGVFPKGQKKICKMKFSDGREVVCCEDHLWSVTTNYGVKSVKTVRQLIDSNKIITYKKNGNINFGFYIPSTVVEFKNSDSISIDPYFLGVLLGDGSLSETGSIEISIGIKKEHILNKLVLPTGIKFNSKYIESKNSFRVKFIGQTPDGKYLHDILKDLGLLGVLSSTKFIPKCYLYSSIENRKKLLQGLLDTDGHINKKGLFEFSTISNNLANNFLELIYSLGLSSKIEILERKQDSSYSDRNIYRIFQRKDYKYGNKLVAITETDDLTEMQCIKVSNPDSLYITDDYIVTHNTTTTTLLIQAILKESKKYMSSGANVNELKRGMNLALEFVLKNLSEISKKITTREDILKIATISANDDIKIGTLLADIYEEVGQDGLISISIDDVNPDISVKYINGFEINNGSASSKFYNDIENQRTVFKNPLILATENEISSAVEIGFAIMESRKLERPLLILAKSFSDEVIKEMSINIQRGLQVSLVKSPNFGEERRKVLEDISTILDATLVADDLGVTFKSFRPTYYGSCERVEVYSHNTIFFNGAGNLENIEERKNFLNKLIRESQDLLSKRKLQERVARLYGKIAHIKVGATTEVEKLEIKDRVEDAMLAVKSSLEEGIVPGGGSTFVKISHKLSAHKWKDISEDQVDGVNIIVQALLYPLKTIAENSGVEPAVIINKIQEMDEKVWPSYGYNALTGQFVDLIKDGVIDPAKVLKESIKNSIGVASSLLTTNSILY
jgi:chaperonin GroEL